MAGAKIIQKQGEKVPMATPAPQQKIDLSRRTLEEQLNVLKGPCYAKNGEMMREVEKLVDQLTTMLLEREERIIHQAAEIRKLSEQLERANPKKKG